MRFYFRDKDNAVRCVEGDASLVDLNDRAKAAFQVYNLTGIKAQVPVLGVVDSKVQSESDVA